MPIKKIPSIRPLQDVERLTGLRESRFRRLRIPRSERPIIHRHGPRVADFSENALEKRAVPKTQVYGTLPERIVYKDLERRRIPFDFQSSVMGGRLELGGMVADFVLLDRPLVIRVQGEYWHNKISQKIKDQAQKGILEALGYQVEDIWEMDVYDINRFDDEMSRILDFQPTIGGGIVTNLAPDVADHEKVEDLVVRVAKIENAIFFGGSVSPTITLDTSNYRIHSIVADHISVDTLSAISADMGSLTAGQIVVGTTNKIWLNEGADGVFAIGGATKVSAPFRVTAAGALTATGATISGALTATSGAIGGWTIGATTISNGSVSLDSSIPALLMGATAYGTGTGVFLGNDGGTYKLRIGNPAGERLQWDGTSLSIAGAALTISSGTSMAPEIQFLTGNANSYGYIATTSSGTGVTEAFGLINTGGSALSLGFIYDFTSHVSNIILSSPASDWISTFDDADDSTTSYMTLASIITCKPPYGHTGKVGIVDAAPDYPLEVTGTVEMDGFLMSTGAGAGKVLTSDAGGVGTWTALPATPTVPAVRAYDDANQSINNNSETTITFPHERYDTDTMHDLSTNPERLTATTAGKYHIGANILWAGNANGRRSLLIYYNGTTTCIAATTVLPVTDGTGTRQNVSCDYDLAAGEYVILRCLQTSGGALNVATADAYSPEFWMHRIG